MNIEMRTIPHHPEGKSKKSATSTTKTDSHDIAEILLKVALKHQKSINPLKCLHQYRPLSDHVYVLRVSIMTFSIFPLDGVV
jgi:hypothetical protein